MHCLRTLREDLSYPGNGGKFLNLNKKLERLKRIISGYGSCLIAFSGGVDSTFLLKVASLVLAKDKLLAVTANSPTFPKEELFFAQSIAKRLRLRLRIIETKELKDKRFIRNSLNRCYFCKKGLFTELKDIAKRSNLNYVLDGSNLSDKVDFRAGERAKKELIIKSPLCEAGLTKQDIRKLSKQFGLNTWDKPSLACLASRVPYGVTISKQLLERIHKAETYLKTIGIKQVRLRHYNGLCRIEVSKKDFGRLMNKSSKVVDRFKKLGYNYVTLDLEGYRTGSLNEVIKQ
jgi:uncharacterized protein